MGQLKLVYVIHEKDLDDNETSVIGVVSSVEKADKLIQEYYGEFKEISFRDIRDSSLEYSKVIEVDFNGIDIGRYELTVEYFNIDRL